MAVKNVLFVVADQWRADCLSAVGHRVVRTPHLDALAADGVIFTSHFAQASPCGPSRASLLTGMYLHNHHSCRNGTPLDARFTNLALEMRRGGYDSSLIGYTDTSLDPRSRDPHDPALRTDESVMPGFTPVLALPFYNPARWTAWLRRVGYDVAASGFRDAMRQVSGYPDAERRGPTYAPAIYKAEHSDTTFVTDAALDFIAAKGDEPWFLHLAYLRPHPPFVAPAPYNALYHPDDVPGFRRAPTPQVEAAQHPYLAWLLARERAAGAVPGDAHLRQLCATYYGLITEVDHHLGRLVAWLRRNGRYDETLIVFSSDHGEMLGDHWYLGKDGYFDQAYHVPLIVRWPGGDGGRGRAVDAFTESIDLMPTMLELVGLPVPAQCDGRSLVPWLRGDTPADWRQEAHWEFDFRDVVDGVPELALGLRLEECRLAVVRDRRGKYVHFAALPPLLFDLERDPDELDNRAGDPAAAPRLLAYAQKLLSWHMTHDERTLSGTLLTSAGPVERPAARR